MPQSPTQCIETSATGDNPNENVVSGDTDAHNTQSVNQNCTVKQQEVAAHYTHLGRNWGGINQKQKEVSGNKNTKGGTNSHNTRPQDLDSNLKQQQQAKQHKNWSQGHKTKRGSKGKKPKQYWTRYYTGQNYNQNNFHGKRAQNNNYQDPRQRIQNYQGPPRSYVFQDRRKYNDTRVNQCSESRSCESGPPHARKLTSKQLLQGIVDLVEITMTKQS